MPPRTRRSARTGAASTPSSAALLVLLDVLTTDDLLDLALSFCTEEALRAAYASCRAFRAAAVPHLRRLLSIALVGQTPENKQASRLGVFLKRTALVNRFASYAKAGDDGTMLWHAAGSWYVGKAADLGQERGWATLRVCCLRPNASTVTWKVRDGAAWVDAPALRCLAGDALAAEFAKAAPQIALVGPTPQNLQADRLGVFLKRDELVNGYPSYTKAGDDGVMLWHAGLCWRVGSAANLGQNRGWVKVVDGCLRPEASTVTWRIYNGAHMLDAPELRCLAGDALAAEIAKAAPQIALVGPTPQNLRASKLGVFLKRDELVNGFASYIKAGDDGVMLWRTMLCWRVGSAANLGQRCGWVKVVDGCLRPEASSRMWQVYDGAAWVDAPELRCLAGRPITSCRIWDRREGRWLDADDLHAFEDARVTEPRRSSGLG